MLVSDAKTFIAKIIGGQNDTNIVSLAGDAINATYQKWSNAHDWDFLLQDNEASVIVPTCTLVSGLPQVNAPTTTAFYGINPGQTVSGTNIPANTTVLSVSGDSAGGGINQITLSNNASGSGTSTLTFGGYIPIIAGQDMYNLPADFNRPFDAQLITNPRSLIYIKARMRDRMLVNQTMTGTPTHYTIYKKHTFSAAAQHSHLRLTVIPSANDSLRLRYYRSFNLSDTNVDMPDDFLYVFLEDAKCWLLRQKNAGDTRLPAMEQAVAQALADAIDTDQEATDDEEVRIISQMEVGPDRSVNFSIWDGID